MNSMQQKNQWKDKKYTEKFKPFQVTLLQIELGIDVGQQVNLEEFTETLVFAGIS